MKILVALGTSTGGVGRHVADLVEGLLESGDEVLVAAPDTVLHQFRYAELGARVMALNVRERPDPRSDVSTVRQLRWLAASADVVHAHGSRVGALAALALPRSTPLVVTLHNSVPTGRVRAGVHRVLEQLVSSRADLVLGVSSDLVARMQRLGARRCELAVVPAAVPPETSVDRAAVRRSLGVPEGAPLVVTVARLAPQKDLELLLAAARVLREDHGLDVVSVIAGEGPLRASLERQIVVDDLPVRLLGHRRDVPDLLAAADIVVSTARWEGQPVALQEALHLGAAIVATDAGGTADVVGDAAILVPVGDVGALTKALADVLRHGAVRDDLRSRAMHRGGELPTKADAIVAARTAYASVIC